MDRLRIFAIIGLFLSAPLLADVHSKKYGEARGYPLASSEFESERDEFVIAEYSGQRFEDGKRNPAFDQEFHWVRATGVSAPLSKVDIDWPAFRNPESWVTRHPILAIVVFKEGKVVFEKYQYARNSKMRFNSLSMAKTLTAYAIGIAVDEGKVDINRPVSDYLPQLLGTPLGGVSVRNHLKMASGSSFVYDVKGDARSYYLNKFAGKQCGMDHCVDFPSLATR